MWEALEWLGWGSRLRNAIMRYNMDKAANSTTRSIIHQFRFSDRHCRLSSRIGNHPKFRGNRNQRKYMAPLCVCVTLVAQLHEVYGYPHTRQVLAVVTALKDLPK